MNSWQLIDEVRDFSGPENSGAEVTYSAGSGRIWRVTVALNERWLGEARKWGTRVIVVVNRINRKSDESEPRSIPIWHFDFVLNYKKPTQVIYIPFPYREGKHFAHYELLINLIAFRDTPASIDYKIEEYALALPRGYVIAYTTSLSTQVRTHPRALDIEASNEDRELVLVNVSESKCEVSVVEFVGPHWHAHKRYYLAANDEIKFRVPARHRAEISVVNADGFGYIVVSEAQSDDQSAIIEVTSGDEIRPDERAWVGSLGYEKGGLLLTNAHVCPTRGEIVYLTQHNRRLGVVKRVADIKTVSQLELLLNALLNIKLPENLVDVAAIEPARGVRYKPFRDYPARIAEPRPGMRVYSRGRTSGEREGVIKDVNVTLMLPWPHDRKYAIFTDCIMIEMPTRPGDSGSLVVSDEGVVGLIFAGTNDSKFGFAIKAANIAKWLGLASDDHKSIRSAKVRV